MKRLIIAVCLLASAAAVIAQLAFGQFVTVNSSTSAPVQLTNNNTKVRSVTVFGFKGFQTSNTTTCYIGSGSSTDGKQGVPIIPGGTAIFKTSDGSRSIALSNLWLDVTTAGDGLVIYYE